MSRSCLLYGQCNANVTSQRTRSSHTMPDWTSMAESKESTEWTISRLTHLLWHDLQLDLWSSLASSSVGLFAKSILLWLIHKLQLRWTSTWNFHRVSRPCTGTPKITCWSWKRTSTVKSKLVVSGSFLVDKLLSMGLITSLIDDCVFFRDDIIFMVYVDNGIFLGNDDLKLQDTIKEIQDLGLLKIKVTQLTTLVSTSRNYEMVLKNSPNAP